MAQAIQQLASGLTVGYATFGRRDGVPGSVGHSIHDGDTVTVMANGNLGVRFLGVDAPESTFPLPGERAFRSLGSAPWEEFLADPLAAPFDPPLSPGLVAHLEDRIGPGAASNHHRHAKAAERALEAEVRSDLAELGQAPETFQFFLAFAHEVMDRYGRLLAYINRRQASEPRPDSYNERLLMAGLVNPYFIWPNVNPFRRQSRLVDAVPAPGTANHLANAEATLRRARLAVQSARQGKIGIFEAVDPLRLDAFEVRYLARRQAPDRWIIDLSKNDVRLLPPSDYHMIRHPEDRLFIPAEYVPLFVERGWQRAA
jgi:endonuclease YncB( thermonuclease family)